MPIESRSQTISLCDAVKSEIPHLWLLRYVSSYSTRPGNNEALHGAGSVAEVVALNQRTKDHKAIASFVWAGQRLQFAARGLVEVDDRTDGGSSGQEKIDRLAWCGLGLLLDCWRRLIVVVRVTGKVLVR